AMVDVPTIVAALARKIDRILQGFERRKVEAVSLLVDTRGCTHEFLKQPECFLRLLYPGDPCNSEAAILTIGGRIQNRRLGLSQGIAVSDNCVQLRGGEGAIPTCVWF